MANVLLTKCWQRVPLHGSVVLNLSWKYFDCCAFACPPLAAFTFSPPHLIPISTQRRVVQILFHTPPGHLFAMDPLLRQMTAHALQISHTFSKLDSAVFECLFVCQSVLLPARGATPDRNQSSSGDSPSFVYLPVVLLSLPLAVYFYFHADFNLVYFCCRSKCYLLESLIN